MKKILTVRKKDSAEKIDYLQKSGHLLSSKEVNTLDVESAYYLALTRETKHKGYDGFKEEVNS